MEKPLENALFHKKPSGVFLMDGIEVAHTLQCCHGGEHFVSIKGSGIRRGFCRNCQMVTCGKPECDPCVPWEEKLNLGEGAKKLSQSQTFGDLSGDEALFISSGERLLL